MTTIAAELDAAIREACPHIEGVTIGDYDQRTTWSVRFTAEATPEEMAAANAVLAAFVASADATRGP